MKPSYVTLFLLISCRIVLLGQIGEGTFLGQSDAASLSTGGQLVHHTMSDTGFIGVHVQRPFGLKAFDRVAIHAAFPIKNGNVNGAFTQVGDDILMERSILVGAERKLSQIIHLNVRCGVYFVKTIEGVSGQSVYADIETIYYLTSWLTIGCRLINPTGSVAFLNHEKKRLEQSCNIGLTYRIGKTVLLLFEEEKRPRQPIVTRFGFGYQLGQRLIVNGGVSAYPLQPSWGVLVKTGKIHCALGFRSHPYLGLTSGMSLNYHLQ